MDKKRIAIIGAGWRTEFYMKIASQLDQFYQVSGVVVRDKDKYQDFARQWSVDLYSAIEEIPNYMALDFVIVSVSKTAARQVLATVKQTGLPILMETPAGVTKEGLEEIEAAFEAYPIQVAEQYHLQPHFISRIELIGQGYIGKVNHVYLSVCHSYHAISLIRRLLGVDCPDFTVSAFVKREKLNNLTMRHDVRSEESHVDHVVAHIDFGNKTAIYDFTVGQYFSPIRPSHVIVKGDNGEMTDNRVNYYRDDKFIVSQLNRYEMGIEGDLHPLALDYITCEGKVVFENPYKQIGFSDEEIAMALCLKKMAEYVQSGQSFYSLKEACYDALIGICIDEAVDQKK